ncbi:MAG: flagellar basal body P-ring formation protein FlgA [Proteobacteria bacterium]|nr:flagellar basal body P-ring formation protein FlgA [Pseudomonadota bacterium]
MICKLSRCALTAAGLMYAVNAAAGEQNMPQQIPTVTRTIQAGELISDADIEIRDMTGRGLPSGTVLHKADLIGREAMRTLYPGSPITQRTVRKPPLARKGATVTVYFQARGLHLQTDGKLLEDGGAGETVRLMTELSSRVITGTVMEDGTIQVN